MTELLALRVPSPPLPEGPVRFPISAPWARVDGSSLCVAVVWFVDYERFLAGLGAGMYCDGNGGRTVVDVSIPVRRLSYITTPSSTTYTRKSLKTSAMHEKPRPPLTKSLKYLGGPMYATHCSVTALMTLQREEEGFETVMERENVQSVENHPLQDYQMQLMLLEQQNKKRLRIKRREKGNSKANERGV
jgi:hypothetical protein